MDPGAYLGSIWVPLGSMMPGYATSLLQLLGGEWLYSFSHVSCCANGVIFVLQLRLTAESSVVSGSPVCQCGVFPCAASWYLVALF
jgi:hypothetical protein